MGFGPRGVLREENDDAGALAPAEHHQHVQVDQGQVALRVRATTSILPASLR